jgi:purine-binding chemotaxis protein CheW
MRERKRTTDAQTQYATLYVGDLLLGVDIQCVEEINRQVELTSAPQAPPCVRGVINLRGEVATVLDLRMILGLSPTDVTRLTRNVIVKDGGERIGLLVDRVGDVVSIPDDGIEPPPANVHGVDAIYFRGIHKFDARLLVILDLDAVLSLETSRN